MKWEVNRTSWKRDEKKEKSLLKCSRTVEWNSRVLVGNFSSILIINALDKTEFIDSTRGVEGHKLVIEIPLYGALG